MGAVSTYRDQERERAEAMRMRQEMEARNRAENATDWSGILGTVGTGVDLIFGTGGLGAAGGAALGGLLEGDANEVAAGVKKFAEDGEDDELEVWKKRLAQLTKEKEQAPYLGYGADTAAFSSSYTSPDMGGL
jgi:hypothetical protein